MDQLLSYILFAIMAIIGGIPTVFLVLSIPVIIVWKVYRKIRFGYKLTD